MTIEAAAYPTSERANSHFSHRFVRVMTKVCLAQELGPTAAWLLTIIVHTEDAAHYRRAVTFWDDQLSALIGASSRKTLSTIRQKIVEAGWLHYEPGSKGRIARYWVVIPEYARNLDDEPTDEGDSCQFQDASGVNFTPQENRNGTATAPKAHRNGTAKGAHSNPIPNPIPNTDAQPESAAERVSTRAKKKKPDAEVPEKLKELISAVNALPEGMCSKCANPESKEISKGWARVMKDPDALAAFDDVPGLMARIRGSPFLHGKSWFRITWLFSKDRDRATWNVLKIDGVRYVDSNINRNQRNGTKPTITSARHDPEQPYSSL